MLALLARNSLRYMQRQPWQSALAVLGITLGVAVVVAIDLTQASARRAFDYATAGLAGEATHRIIASGTTLPEQVYRDIRLDGRFRRAAPMVEGRLRVGGTAVKLLGIDPLAEGALRDSWFAGAAPDGETDLPTRLINEPGTVFISTPLRDRLDGLPARLEATNRAGPVSLRPLGVLDPARRQPALHADELIVADIATAQELLGMAGRLSRIELALGDARAEALQALLPAGVVLQTLESQRATLGEMTGAFHTNLTALSLLALMVGVFLVYNAQSFAIVQRRTQFATLRAMGLRRGELLALVLVEALACGLAGAVLGCALGIVLARSLLHLVARTINDLYFRTSITGLELDPASLATGVVLAVAGALAAALVPALAAARTPPRLGLSRAALESGARRVVGLAVRLGAGAAVAGLALLLLPGGGLGAGFAGLFLLLSAVALFTPAVLLGLARLLGALAIIARHPAPALTVRSLGASPSRTGTAAAVLTVAVATTIGIGIMVDSFRGSVLDWLDAVLQADYYVSTATGEPGGGLTLANVAALGRVAGVTDVTHVHRLEVISDSGPANLQVYRFNAPARAGFRFRELAMPRDAFWAALESDDTLMVSEPFASHQGVGAGDQLTLVTPAGPRAFSIGAVYQDYGSDRGSIATSRAVFDRYWRDDALTGIGVYVSAGTDEARLRADLRAALPPALTLDIISNSAIKALSLAVFDRTFAITEVLRVIAALVAMVGTFSALLAIQLERRRELAVLRAIGIGPRQLHGIVIGESALIGLAAGLLAVPAGIMVAVCLVEVINKRAFGWTMDMHIGAGEVLTGVLMAVAAATLAGWYPARRSLRIEPASAMRLE